MSRFVHNSKRKMAESCLCGLYHLMRKEKQYVPGESSVLSPTVSEVSKLPLQGTIHGQTMTFSYNPRRQLKYVKLNQNKT